MQPPNIQAIVYLYYRKKSYPFLNFNWTKVLENDFIYFLVLFSLLCEIRKMKAERTEEAICFLLSFIRASRPWLSSSAARAATEAVRMRRNPFISEIERTGAMWKWKLILIFLVYCYSNLFLYAPTWSDFSIPWESNSRVTS